MSHSNSKHRHAPRKPKALPRTTTTSPTSAPTTFLFVVNELVIDPSLPSLPQDQYLNYMPPLHRTAYLPSHPGTVFRYRAGTITPAPDHIFYQPDPSVSGTIVRLSPDGSILSLPPPYKTQSVVSCSPHIPLLVLDSDATLGSTLRGTWCPTCRIPSDDAYAWRLVHFEHDVDNTGVSYANASFKGQTWVSGRNPAWMPALVPEVYRDPRATVPSRGLGGDLGIVIGMMAFHGGRNVGGASEVFRGGWWQGRRWCGPRGSPVGYPLPDEAPRGFVVQICLDVAENDEVGKNEAEVRMVELERNGILVEG